MKYNCLLNFDSLKLCLPGFSVHGIFQARVLDGVPLPSPNIYSKRSQILVTS